MVGEEEISPSQEIDFCTMGMFIIGKTVFLSQNTLLFNRPISRLSPSEAITFAEPCSHNGKSQVQRVANSSLRPLIGLLLRFCFYLDS
jgi:hypothetical protein